MIKNKEKQFEKPKLQIESNMSIFINMHSIKFFNFDIEKQIIKNKIQNESGSKESRREDQPTKILKNKDKNEFILRTIINQKVYVIKFNDDFQVNE